MYKLFLFFFALIPYNYSNIVPVILNKIQVNLAFNIKILFDSKENVSNEKFHQKIVNDFAKKNKIIIGDKLKNITVNEKFLIFLKKISDESVVEKDEIYIKLKIHEFNLKKNEKNLISLENKPSNYNSIIEIIEKQEESIVKERGYKVLLDGQIKIYDNKTQYKTFFFDNKFSNYNLNFLFFNKINFNGDTSEILKGFFEYFEYLNHYGGLKLIHDPHDLINNQQEIFKDFILLLNGIKLFNNGFFESLFFSGPQKNSFLESNSYYLKFSKSQYLDLFNPDSKFNKLWFGENNKDAILKNNQTNSSENFVKYQNIFNELFGKVNSYKNLSEINVDLYNSLKKISKNYYESLSFGFWIGFDSNLTLNKIRGIFLGMDIINLLCVKSINSLNEFIDETFVIHGSFVFTLRILLHQKFFTKYWIGLSFIEKTKMDPGIFRSNINNESINSVLDESIKENWNKLKSANNIFHHIFISFIIFYKNIKIHLSINPIHLFLYRIFNIELTLGHLIHETNFTNVRVNSFQNKVNEENESYLRLLNY